MTDAPACVWHNRDEETKDTSGHWPPSLPFLCSCFSSEFNINSTSVSPACSPLLGHPCDCPHSPPRCRKEAGQAAVLLCMDKCISPHPQTLFLPRVRLFFAHIEGVGLGEETSVSGGFIFFYIKHLSAPLYFKLLIWELCHPTAGKVLFWFGFLLSECQLPLLAAQLFLAPLSRCLLEHRAAPPGKTVEFLKGQKSQEVCFLSLRSHPQ